MAKHGLSLREAAADEPPGEASRTAAAAPPAPEPSLAVPGIRWEQRLLTVLRVQLDAPEGTASFQLAGVLERLISKVTSFGVRIGPYRSDIPIHPRPIADFEVLGTERT